MQKYIFFFNTVFIYFIDSLSNLTCQNKQWDKIIYSDLANETVFTDFFLNGKQQNWLVVYDKRFRKVLKAFLKNVKIIRAAGGLVKGFDNTYLFIYRHNKWDLPKGKAEQGENMWQTALREVKEECGFTELERGEYICKTYHIYKQEEEFILKKTYWFGMNSAANERLIPQEEEGITRVQWMNLEEIKSVVYGNTYENIRLLIGMYFEKEKRLEV